MIRDLAVLLNAHIPLATALKILADSTSPKTKIILANIKNNVEAGMSLSKACAQYPKVYSSMMCKLIEAGERAAALPTVLNDLADYQDRMGQFKSRVIKAIFYPVVVFIVAMLITLALLLFVVPQFENLFSSMGAELPALTRTVIFISDSIKNYWWLLLIMIMTMSLGIYYYAEKLLSLPLIRKVQARIYISRFCRTLSILLIAGVPIVDGLFLMVESDVRDKILRGEMLSDALQSTSRFSTMMIQMIKVGEASGMLSQMLSRIALMTETELDGILSRFTQLLEPCIMIFMGLFIGGLVIAMYLPVFQLGRVV
ncbi:MAG: type II secretion system F family protein [Gammaproteobacteria bacterium]|nr:type II secretion system F family protein [Gammaproteobacteria bacterium]